MREKQPAVNVSALIARLYGGAGLDTEARAAEARDVDVAAVVVDDVPLGDAASERRLIAFFECLLRAGMQSYSHMQSVLERYDTLAKRIGGATQEARRLVVGTVARVWQKHPPTIITVLDRFQK